MCPGLLLSKDLHARSQSLPPGYHSRNVIKKSGVDELMVECDDQMLPEYLIQF